MGEVGVDTKGGVGVGVDMKEVVDKRGASEEMGACEGQGPYGFHPISESQAGADDSNANTWPSFLGFLWKERKNKE